ncbi:DUF551 domain-containing protein [Acinetobacter johnsonii]|uniref:DUF551 domain-containing protein n=1 Tax=Acinetobacter johnsonii TaxID=40214 RepID=UPI0013310C78|nr:DUF551 domain-containing protein [Acinetobacter johnsonii]
MTKLELDLLKLSEGKSLEFAADYAAIIPQIIEVLKTQNTPESFEQAYSEIFCPIVQRPYPRLENGDYKYIEIDQGWKLWQAATAQAVPEWISVKEKTPPTDETVLVCWDYHPDVEPEKEYITLDEDLNEYWPNCEAEPPTHWKLIPKPPKAQEQSHD